MPGIPPPYADTEGNAPTPQSALSTLRRIIRDARQQWQAHDYVAHGYIPAYYATRYRRNPYTATLRDAYCQSSSTLPTTLPPPPPAPENPLYELACLLPINPQRALFGGSEVLPLTVELHRDDHGLPFTWEAVDRLTLCRVFSWSVPSPGDIAFLAEHADSTSVVEVGAGSGYWAAQLTRAGFVVHAYDKTPPGRHNRYCPVGPYSPVEAAPAEVSSRHPGALLLLCWPPMEGSAAHTALTHHRGDTVFYVGESAGGCTGDDAFHDLLQRDYTLHAVSPHHLTWEGIHCSVQVWHRSAG